MLSVSLDKDDAPEGTANLAHFGPIPVPIGADFLTFQVINGDLYAFYYKDESIHVLKYWETRWRKYRQIRAQVPNTAQIYVAETLNEQKPGGFRPLRPLILGLPKNSPTISSVFLPYLPLV